MPAVTTDAEIEAARDALADKLAELRARAQRVRRLAEPATYWRMPIVRFGLGLSVGYLLGRPGRAARAAAPGAHEGLLHAIVRAALSAATAAVIRRALATDRLQLTVGVNDRPEG